MKKLTFRKKVANLWSLATRGIEVYDYKGERVNFQDWSSQFIDTKSTPIEETIFTTVANEFSKLDLFAYKQNEKDGILIYDELNKDNLNIVLRLRPNQFLTSYSFKYIVAYQLMKYGNSINVINRDIRGNVESITPLDMNDYFVGNGYELNDGTIFMKLKNKHTDNVELLRYEDCLHLRLNSNDIFYGDENKYLNGGSTIVKLIDTQLNTLLNEMLASGEIRGIVTVGNASTGSLNNALLGNNEKESKQAEIVSRIKSANGGGVLVLDSGEEWKELNTPFNTLDSSQMEELMKYLYTFKGINEKVINGTADESEMEVFFNKSIAPIVEQFIDESNYKLLSKTARTQGTKIDYRRNPFEYVSIDRAVDVAYKGAMFTTINEMRSMLFKLPPVDNGNEVLENLNFAKGETANE